jgi:hypothetical protein
VAATKTKPLTFEAEILGRGPGGAWAYLRFPFSAEERFGRKGQVPIRGTINGFAFRNSLMPRDGIHILGVSKELQQGAGAAVGDTVTVALELDDAPREVAVPADLQSALKKAPPQAGVFAVLSYSHKKEFVEWIESAKRPETRASRIEKTLAMLLERKTPKG